MRRAVVLVGMCGCSSIFGLEDPRLGDAAMADRMRDMAVDMPGDTPPGPWGDISVALSSADAIDDPALTDDMLEMYLDRAENIAVSKRNSVDEPWPAPTDVVELSSVSLDTTPEVAGDGLTIVFSSNRPGSVNGDIWLSTRQSRSSPWGTPERVAELSSDAIDYAGSITTLQVALSSTRISGNADLFWSNRASAAAAWPAPEALASLNSPSEDVNPFIMRDGSAIYFDSQRNTATVQDLYVAAWLGNGAWGPPMRIEELSTDDSEADPWVSTDGRTMYFVSNRVGGVNRIYRARR